MAAQSIAWYQRRIAELEEAEDVAYTALGKECIEHARTRALAAHLAAVLCDFDAMHQRDMAERQNTVLGEARKAGLL